MNTSHAAPGGYGPPGGGYGPPPPGGFGGQEGGFGSPPGFGGPPPGFGGPAGPPGFGGPPGPFNDQAIAKVKAPAIAMMVCSIIGVLVQLVSLVTHLIGTGVGMAQDDGNEVTHLLSGAFGVVMNVVGIAMSGFCIWGFLKMMKLESRTLSYVAVIASMTPCFGSCWCLNLWIGIWALIALADPVVKANHH